VLGRIDALEIDLKGRKLDSGQETYAEPPSGYRRTRMWLAPEGRVPVRMESDVLLGRVRAELVEAESGS
jgi:hypothetical protein